MQHKRQKQTFIRRKNEGKNEGNYSFWLDIATIYQRPSRICQQAKTTTYSVFEPKKYRLINRLICRMWQRYKNLNASVQNLVTRFARNNDSSNPYLLLSKKKTDIRADVCFLLADYINLSSHGSICFANLHLKDLTEWCYGFNCIINP